MLLAAIDENHRGTYDFLYLPIDFKVYNLLFQELFIIPVSLTFFQTCAADYVFFFF